MTERRLLELEKEGLLRRRTSLSSPEWIAPPASHRGPQPPEGYVVSFAKFHHHGLGAPPSRFMRALCFHYGVDDEVTARVRAAIAGDFQSEHVSGFPMRRDAGSIDLVRFLLFSRCA